MPDSEQAEPHEQDDCDDCQKERAENNQLINFYERVNKIQDKVRKIKPIVSLQGEGNNKNNHKLETITQKIIKPPHLQLSGVNEKEMGYELACALLEREIKMKRENQRLNQRINQMKEANAQLTREKQMKKSQVQPSSPSSSKNSFFESPRLGAPPLNKRDSLDSAIEKDTSEKSFWGFDLQPRRGGHNDRGRYSERLVMEETHSNTNSSSLSSFQYTERMSSFKNPDPEMVTQVPKYQTATYDKMNLWLYQFNIEEDVGKPKSSTRKPKY